MLRLYIRPSCPYCIRVLDAIEGLDLRIGADVQICDITTKMHLAELLQYGKKQQVPFICDIESGLRMYESQDIIAYLRKYAAGLQRS